MISTITRASRSIRTPASAILLMLLLLPASSHAADVTVGCFGGSGGTYPSINAALAAIGPVGPSTITVTGTCNESVGLFKARSITIMALVAGGAGSGGATIVGRQDNDTFDIGLFSQNITLQNLEIQATLPLRSELGPPFSTTPKPTSSRVTFTTTQTAGLARTAPRRSLSTAPCFRTAAMAMGWT